MPAAIFPRYARAPAPLDTQGSFRDVPSARDSNGAGSQSVSERGLRGQPSSIHLRATAWAASTCVELAPAAPQIDSNAERVVALGMRLKLGSTRQGPQGPSIRNFFDTTNVKNRC